jgi:DNA primase
MAITPQWKDELRARITLSTLVQRSVKLTRAGREWKGCCPFHDEKTPSFYVNDQKAFYHCFGCGAHGDAISWMVDQQGLQFMDAVKELAAMAGMEVPAPDPVMAKRAEERASLIDVTEAAQKFFVNSLAGPSGGAAREYLQKRGFSSQIMAEFGFGWALDDRQALPKALSAFNEEMLEGAGMRAANEHGERYDRFRGRVMLPIQDARGRVIAFGGRILDKRDGVAKYLNSPDTELFDKGRTLYNLHRAAPAARQSGRVVVVEGYMDVIALANAGIADAVAPLGTALTEMQLEMLWRMVEVPVLCFDGDAAGQRAAIRAVERALPLLKAPNSLKIVHLPAGMDPDDVIKEYGAAYFENLISNAAPLVRFIWETEKNATPLNTPEEKSYLRQRLIDQAFTIQDENLKKLYRTELINLYYSSLYPQRFGSPTKVAHGLLSSENLALLRHFIAHGHREHLLRACLAAIARRPYLFLRYVELIKRYKPPTTEIQLALDVFWGATQALDDNSELPDRLDEIAAWKGPLPYSFLKPDATEEFVIKCLDEAFFILVVKPEAEEECRKAQLRFESDPTEIREQEFMRLIQVKQNALKREKAIARFAMQ